MTKTVITAGGFDRMDSRKVRFLHEASKAGELHVLMFDDALIEQTTGAGPAFPLAERVYFVENIRYVKRVHTISRLNQLEDAAALIGCQVDEWLSLPSDGIPGFERCAGSRKIDFREISEDSLTGYPEHDYNRDESSDRKVIVTGCFDWFHTGHIRFFEEAADYGHLYVILGHDKNIEALKGPGHPMFPEQERQYLAGAIRFVKEALISTGDGWLDAEPEIERLKPQGYVVNQDGDKDVKRRYCQDHGIEYIVLKREPKPGLKRRTSTDLRGF
jgi:cytidyltransferase-like protein